VSLLANVSWLPFDNEAIEKNAAINALTSVVSTNKTFRHCKGTTGFDEKEIFEAFSCRKLQRDDGALYIFLVGGVGDVELLMV
jgi:hypothetical protein